jgi:hypothetical protein
MEKDRRRTEVNALVFLILYTTSIELGEYKKM